MGQDSSQTGQADYYLAQVSSASLYYPFGWEMPGRKFVSGEEYRFGFNGKETDEDATSGSYDFGARMYNSQLGRWWSVDALSSEYPSASPYNFALNTPIQAMDPDGNLVIFVNGFWGSGTGACCGGLMGYWGDDWAKRVMSSIGDNKAMFFDG